MCYKVSLEITSTTRFFLVNITYSDWWDKSRTARYYNSLRRDALMSSARTKLWKKEKNGLLLRVPDANEAHC